MLHRKLSYISVKTLIKKKIYPPHFSLGASCAHWPLGIGIEAPAHRRPQDLHLLEPRSTWSGPRGRLESDAG